MSPTPLRVHQRISRTLTLQIGNYLADKNCELYYAPSDVLNDNGKYVNAGQFAEDSKVKVNIFDDFYIDLGEVFGE